MRIEISIKIKKTFFISTTIQMLFFANLPPSLCEDFSGEFNSSPKEQKNIGDISCKTKEYLRDYISNHNNQRYTSNLFSSEKCFVMKKYWGITYKNPKKNQGDFTEFYIKTKTHGELKTYGAPIPDED